MYQKCKKKLIQQNLILPFSSLQGVIRSLNEQKKLNQVYCTETRPYNQGARLTAYELVYEKMNASLICDSMVAACIMQHKVNLIYWISLYMN